MCIRDRKFHFWRAGTSSEYLGQVCISRSSGQGHRVKVTGAKTRKTAFDWSLKGNRVVGKLTTFDITAIIRCDYINTTFHNV